MDVQRLYSTKYILLLAAFILCISIFLWALKDKSVYSVVEASSKHAVVYYGQALSRVIMSS